MKTIKRPAAMIAAAVVAFAMVTPTAALAADGNRGHDRGHAAGDRDHPKGKREANAKHEAKGEHEVNAKHEAKGKHEAEHTNQRNVSADRNTKGGPWNVKAPLCHATSSATNPYVKITVSHRAIVKGTGHGGHDGDIIPPFTYQPSRDAAPTEFPGQNWDAEGRAIYDNGCAVAIGGDVREDSRADGDLDATAAPAAPESPVDDEVLGVVIDADPPTGEGGDVEVLGVSGSRETDTDTVATDADVLADTEIQVAQATDDERSTGALAMTGASLLVLLVGGLTALVAGAGLLRRRG